MGADVACTECKGPFSGLRGGGWGASGVNPQPHPNIPCCMLNSSLTHKVQYIGPGFPDRPRLSLRLAPGSGEQETNKPWGFSGSSGASFGPLGFIRLQQKPVTGGWPAGGPLCLWCSNRIKAPILETQRVWNISSYTARPWACTL